MEIVRLNRSSRIRAGHLWVFSNELSESPKKYEPGSLVELRDRQDLFLGVGYINPQSLIAVRILTFNKEKINPDFFRKRILEAIDYRKRFIGNTNSYRVVFSEGDFLPGLIADKYEDCLSIQISTMGMEKQSETIINIIDDIFSPSAIVLRNDNKSRLLEGLKREKKIIKGSLDKLPVIKEDSLLFETDPFSGQKTGFFLDQRENRTAFSKLINNGRGLDLFCYEGAWSILLADRGAEVTGIDESGSAIARAGQNAELNGLSKKCSFKKADVFSFLKEEISNEASYDFIVLDPPAFVKSKSKIREALRGYKEINANALRLLKRGGLLATSSCSYHIDKETFIELLRSAAKDAGKQVRLMELRGQAKDHPILLSMPETEYLKCAFLEVG